MTDQLRILHALGEELERATQLDEQRSATRRRRRWRPHGLPLLALVTGLSAAGVAAAATGLFGIGDPVPAPRAADVPVEARPVGSTALLAGVPAADPGGDPAWDVRVSRTRTGELCTAVGQVVDGTFGIVGLDRRFRALPLGSADACGTPPAGSQVQVGARAANGRDTMTARTLVVGIAGPQVASIVLQRDGRSTPLRLGRRRAFVAALVGLPELNQPRLQITDRRGATRTVALAGADDQTTPDPGGGTPWTVRVGDAETFTHPMIRGHVTAAAGTRCVLAERGEDSRAVYPAATQLAMARTPIACRAPGVDAPVIASIRRLVPGETPASRYSFGLNPSRTVAFGLVSDEVLRLELRTPQGATPVPITRRRGFAAILDGRVDPTRLELRARLRDGSVVATRGETATLLTESGRRLQLPVAPPWISVERAPRFPTSRSGRTRIPGSESVGPPVADPAGGPDWAASSWREVATGGPTGMNDPGRGRRELQCATFGPLVDGQVRRARGAGVGAGPASSMFPGLECTVASLSPRTTVNGTRRRLGYFANPTVYVDDPASATPHLARVEISGVYPGVVRAEVLGLPRGRQVRATVSANGSVLALLPPEAARPEATVRLRLHFHTGETVLTGITGFSPPRRRPAARAVDPKGGAGWAVQSAQLATPNIASSPGQLIDGRLGQISDRTGQVFLLQGGGGDPRYTATSGRRPVHFREQVVPDDGATLDELSPADVARRTLPGRTVIYGSAAPGVTRVTLQTPRDVRTVRPSEPGGLFLVVYDGQFTRGTITATATGPGIRGVSRRRVQSAR